MKRLILYFNKKMRRFSNYKDFMDSYRSQVDC